MSETYTAKWQSCLDFFKSHLQTSEQFDAWFEPLSIKSYEDNKLTLFAPSGYFVEQLELRFLRLLTVGIREYFGQDTELYYQYNEINEEPPRVVITTKDTTKSQSQKPAAQDEESEFDSFLNPRYTFDNYCESKSNKLARSIGEAIGNNPRMQTFNPLFVFGPTGVGKTHLIQAIGLKVKERFPKARVLYITARLFESQYTAASLAGKVNQFIRAYQSIDVLIMDDVQDLAMGKKESTQNAFFHIFNHLHQNGRLLIMSSDCRPSEMAGFEQRLLSRFKWGATAELEKPDRDLRRSVLALRARQDGLEIPEEVLDYVADNVTESVRELEGVVVSLLAHATVLSHDIDMDLARSVIANSVKLRKRNVPVNFEMVTQHVCAHYDIDPDMIFTSTRKREVSDARQMLMYIAKKHAKMTFTAIGTRLSRKHATVLYACKSIESRLQHDKKLQTDVAEIEKALQVL